MPLACFAGVGPMVRTLVSRHAEIRTSFLVILGGLIRYIWPSLFTRYTGEWSFRLIRNTRTISDRYLVVNYTNPDGAKEIIWCALCNSNALLNAYLSHRSISVSSLLINCLSIGWTMVYATGGYHPLGASTLPQLTNETITYTSRREWAM